MHSGDSAEAPLTPGPIFEMLHAHQRTAALTAAIDLDVFRAVGKGPGDAASIADHCQASERGIRILCDFLTISGVLVKKDGHYHHTPMSAAFLDPRSPSSMASIAQFLGNPAMRGTYNNLAEIVRSGRTVLPGDGTVEPENPIWVQFAESMVPMMAPLAGPLASAVLEGQSGTMRILDIAAGHGLFGIEIAKMNPQAHITGLDWAAVLDGAQKYAGKAGVQDRYNMLPGSAFDVAFDGPYDAMLLTNFLHHFDKPTCVGLLRKIHAALRSDGRCATLEFVPNEDRVSPPAPAAFALTMLTSTAAGDAYTLSELTAMYKEAGFKNISSQPIAMSSHTIVIGHA